jgi:hypothetical protein
MELCFYLLAEWPSSHDVYMLFYAKNLVLFSLFCSYFLLFSFWKRVVIPVLLIFPTAI